MCHRWKLLLSILLIAPVARAGTWGQENWGQLYWGDNPVTAPIEAPVIQSIVADGEDLVVTIADYSAGADGWSVIQNYTVTCGIARPVISDASPVLITGLESDTEYECSVVAANAQGDSPQSIQLASTDSVVNGLNIVIIWAALCRSDNPPVGC
jgi:hypothetical protein